MLVAVRALPARTGLVALMALASLFTAAAPVAAAETEADRVVAIATAQVGDRYSFASTGPDQFDCSGLVWFTFKEAGLRDRIGDKRRTAAGYYKYFKQLGRADKLNPQPGDLVVWGNNQHIGVYVGEGMAVSALNKRLGVREHKVTGWLSMRLKAYLHVDLER